MDLDRPALKSLLRTLGAGGALAAAAVGAPLGSVAVFLGLSTKAAWDTGLAPDETTRGCSGPSVVRLVGGSADMLRALGSDSEGLASPELVLLTLSFCAAELCGEMLLGLLGSGRRVASGDGVVPMSWISGRVVLAGVLVPDCARGTGDSVRVSDDGDAVKCARDRSAGLPLRMVILAAAEAVVIISGLSALRPSSSENWKSNFGDGADWAKSKSNPSLIMIDDLEDVLVACVLTILMVSLDRIEEGAEMGVGVELFREAGM